MSMTTYTSLVYYLFIYLFLGGGGGGGTGYRETDNIMHHSITAFTQYFACVLIAFQQCETAWDQVVCWLVGCLTSQQHASVSQGRICEDKFTCCQTEIEVADQTFYLTQSQYTDTGPTSPSADPISPGAWKGSHWSSN